MQITNARNVNLGSVRRVVQNAQCASKIRI